MQYVGQTINSFNLRLSQHRHNILHNVKCKAPHVAPHFNIPGHDYKCVVLQLIKNEDKSKLNIAESLWIQRLSTMWPHGLNEYNPDNYYSFFWT